jgi:hypothetical protein
MTKTELDNTPKFERVANAIAKQVDKMVTEIRSGAIDYSHVELNGYSITTQNAVIDSGCNMGSVDKIETSGSIDTHATKRALVALEYCMLIGAYNECTPKWWGMRNQFAAIAAMTYDAIENTIRMLVAEKLRQEDNV